MTTTTTTSSTKLFGVDQARRYVSEGMAAFRQGRVSESIQLFNAAEQAEPRFTPFLWQRGISYYYNQQYDLARTQFRTDVSVNPLDVEEIVWDIASALRQDPTTPFPVPNALTLPGRDRRPIMAVVYQLFRGQATEADLATAGHINTAAAAAAGSTSKTNKPLLPLPSITSDKRFTAATAATEAPPARMMERLLLFPISKHFHFSNNA